MIVGKIEILDRFGPDLRPILVFNGTPRNKPKRRI